MRATQEQRLNFKIIETELYNYKNTVKELMFLESEIIEGSPPPNEAIGASRGIDISNPTQSKVMRLMTSAELADKRRKVDAIEFMLRMVDISPNQSKKELLQMKYFEQRYNNEEIMERLNIRRATFFKWQRHIVGLVASRLGLRV